LEPSHYNFLKLEKHHYYSRILKFVIAILDFPQICHEIRIKTTRAQLQVYTKMYITLYLCPPLNDMWLPLVSIFFLLSSSTNELPYISPTGSRGGRRRLPPARAAPLATVGRRRGGGGHRMRGGENRGVRPRRPATTSAVGRAGGLLARARRGGLRREQVVPVSAVGRPCLFAW
jgi:hypothetical protein